MPEFLIRYSVARFMAHYESTTHTHHAILIEAETRVDALVTAYDYLTRKGYAVDTEWITELKWDPVRASMRKGSPFDQAAFDEVFDRATAKGQTHLLGLTDDEVRMIRAAGVPIGEHTGDVCFDSISVHQTTHKGRVISLAEEKSGGQDSGSRQ